MGSEMLRSKVYLRIVYVGSDSVKGELLLIQGGWSLQWRCGGR